MAPDHFFMERRAKWKMVDQTISGMANNNVLLLIPYLAKGRALW